MMKWIKKIIKVLLIGVLLLAVAGFATYKIVTSGTEFGGEMDEESFLKAQSSPQYDKEEDNFKNNPDVIPSSLSINWEDMRGGQERKPPGPFPMDKALVSRKLDSTGIKATWIGHATVYVEMDGKRILTDPMFSDRAFPVKLVAPQRFNPPAITLEELPPIDIVTISHDHFDHLDMRSVQALAKGGAQFYVGIGIKAHLVEWGINEIQVEEMDWWETAVLDEFRIHCTPARHYSGRRGMNNSTLWTSWVIEGPEHRIFHSGDSGYQDHFFEIGERFGPIDVGFIKVGDYGLDPGWRDIHMYTEQSVMAAKDIQARLMFPIHWGTFDLSNHDWYEPINLAVRFSKEYDVSLVTPRLGQTLAYGDSVQNESWWKELEATSERTKLNH